MKLFIIHKDQMSTDLQIEEHDDTNVPELAEKLHSLRKQYHDVMILTNKDINDLYLMSRKSYERTQKQFYEKKIDK
tara:strand:- start:388 stop:615 length:228 start_codon:yes stop_codon:yes gene_type:complete